MNLDEFTRLGDLEKEDLICAELFKLAGDRGAPPLYNSRTFEIPSESGDYKEVTITLHVRRIEKEGKVKQWEMFGPIGAAGQKPELKKFDPGIYQLKFTQGSLQQLVRVKIDPDPGGGVVP
jgi:hypothetical protein